jgi:hypothetical protein
MSKSRMLPVDKLTCGTNPGEHACIATYWGSRRPGLSGLQSLFGD